MEVLSLVEVGTTCRLEVLPATAGTGGAGGEGAHQLLLEPQ